MSCGEEVGQEGTPLGNYAEGEIELAEECKQLPFGAVRGEDVILEEEGDAVDFLDGKGGLECYRV